MGVKKVMLLVVSVLCYFDLMKVVSEDLFVCLRDIEIKVSVILVINNVDVVIELDFDLIR